MTPLQFRRWYGFSRRMALRGFETATTERRRRMAREVRQFFEIIEEDVGEIVDWDSAPAYIGDRVSQVFDAEHYHERHLKNGSVEERGNRFLNQVTCCVRAGLDLASDPSGGVLGFDVDDLRRMYPIGIPAWIATSFTAPIKAETPGNVGVWL